MSYFIYVYDASVNEMGCHWVRTLCTLHNFWPEDGY